jgi:hypothetical protein
MLASAWDGEKASINAQTLVESNLMKASFPTQ